MNCARCERHVTAASLGGLRIDYARCPHCRQAYAVTSKATPTVVAILGALFSVRLPDAWMAVVVLASMVAIALDWQYVAIDESAIMAPRLTVWLRSLATRERER